MIRTTQNGKGAIVEMEKPGLQGFVAAVFELHSQLGVMSIASAAVHPGTYAEISADIQPEDVRRDGLATIELRYSPSDVRQPTEQWRILLGPSERVRGNDVVFRLVGWH